MLVNFSALTEDLKRLEVTPPLFYLNPSAKRRVFVRTRDVFLPNGSLVEVKAQAQGYSKNLTLSVHRTGERQLGTVSSGMEGCGDWARV